MEAERTIENIVDDIKNKHSIFQITAAITNSGKFGISIKMPALMRVYIGTGNYVDLKLLLTKFEESAQLDAHGTRLVVYESAEISKLPEEDQKIIDTYWGQSDHSILFIEDSIGKIHASNRISFAEGLYQKLIYDRLAAEAAKKSHFSL